MRWILLTILLCLQFSVFAATDIRFTDEELEWIKNNPKIIYGFDSNYAPIEMARNGKHAGVSADYIALLEKKTGLQFIPTTDSVWANVYQSVIDNKVLMLSSVRETASRQAFLDFTPPYIEFNGVIITSKSAFNDPLTLPDLENKKLAVVQGYFWVDFIARDYPQIELQIVENVEDGLISVALGTVDAFLGAMPTITNYVSENNISNLQISGETNYSIALGFGITKNEPLLFSIVNKALVSVSKEQRENINKKWIKVDNQLEYYLYQSTLFRGVVLGLAVSLILLLGFLLWNRTLAQQVESRTKALAELNSTLEQRVSLRTRELEASNKELENIRKKLKNQVEVDVLTGIANRRKLEDRLTAFYREDEYLASDYSLMMIDVDYFKQYNDTYGHHQGDIVLKRIAAQLSKDLRRNGELVARYGGEEFSIFLATADKAKALAVAKTKIAEIRALNITHSGSKVGDHITVSIGIYSVPQGVEVNRKQLLERADKALYKAKEAGRDQVVALEECLLEEA